MRITDPKSAFAMAASAARNKAETIGDKATDAAKKVDAARTKATAKITDTASSGKQKVMESIYRPVFPEQYTHSDYGRPKMIVLSDGSDRQDIEVCEGSIGWSDTAAGIDTLYLYEEAIPFSGIVFYPQALCDSIYYEDSHTPGRYISLDSYFDTLQRDKITELRRIAYELGAKSCTLESLEVAKSVRIAKTKIGARKLASVDASKESTSESSKRIVFSQTFEGNAEPRRPELNWFAHDQEIEFLISTRCNEENANKTKRYRAELDSSSAQTMSVQLAGKLDKALSKLGASVNFSLQGEALEESRRKLVFEVEF